MTADNWVAERLDAGKTSPFCWLIMRVIQYRIRFYTGSAGFSAASAGEALAFEDREQAYAVARNLSGLIIIYGVV
jgi:hypothetical protein